MRILMKRHRLAPYLVPADEQAEEEVRKLKPGQATLVEVKRARNERQHRLYWALVGVIFDHQSRYATRQDLSDALKVAVGHYEEVGKRGEHVIVRPKSIAFANMPQPEFEQFFDRIIKLVCERIIPGTNDTELRAHLEDMVGAGEKAA